MSESVLFETLADEFPAPILSQNGWEHTFTIQEEDALVEGEESKSNPGSCPEPRNLRRSGGHSERDGSTVRERVRQPNRQNRTRRCEGLPKRSAAATAS